MNEQKRKQTEKKMNKMDKNGRKFQNNTKENRTNIHASQNKDKCKLSYK